VQVFEEKWHRYVFQIDLGIAIINYALNKAWPNAEGPPPAWICQLEFLPCDCSVCFFCDHGLTSGIVHTHKLENARVTVPHHKDNSIAVTTGHTPFRVNLQKGSSYCRQCLRKIRKTPEGKKLKSRRHSFSAMTVGWVVQRVTSRFVTNAGMRGTGLMRVCSYKMVLCSKLVVLIFIKNCIYMLHYVYI
jgi:hypothetical protein